MRTLYIKQKVFKILDHYPITDEFGNVVYQVDQEFRFMGNTVHVSAPDGRHLFTVDREILTFLPRYNIHFSNGQQIVIKSNFTFFKRSIDIDPDNLGLTLDGNFWDHEFTLSQNGNTVGTISKQWFSWGDTFQLDIYDESLQDLFVAVIIAVDDIQDMEQSS